MALSKQKILKLKKAIEKRKKANAKKADDWSNLLKRRARSVRRANIV